MATTPMVIAHTPPGHAPTAIPTIPPTIISAPSAPTTTRITSAMRAALLGLRLGCRGVRLDAHGRPIRHDLAHGAPELGAVEAHGDHRVRAHEGRVLDHAVNRLTPGVLQQLGVFLDIF